MTIRGKSRVGSLIGLLLILGLGAGTNRAEAQSAGLAGAGWQLVSFQLFQRGGFPYPSRPFFSPPAPGLDIDINLPRGNLNIGIPGGGGGAVFVDGFFPGSYGAYRYGYSNYGYRVVVPSYPTPRYYQGSHYVPPVSGGLSSPLLTPAPRIPAEPRPRPIDPLGADPRPVEPEVEPAGPPAAAEELPPSRGPELLVDPDNDPARVTRPELSNVNQMRNAIRATARGDEHFAAGEYFEAQAQYRSALRSAPDLAEPYLHYGVGLIATGRFEDAAEQFKIAIDFEPDVVLGEFAISDLYGEALDQKQTHLDALSEAALEADANGRLLFAVGVWLVLEGEWERAAPMLRRAGVLDPTLAGTYLRMVRALPSAGGPAVERPIDEAPNLR